MRGPLWKWRNTLSLGWAQSIIQRLGFVQGQTVSVTAAKDLLVVREPPSRLMLDDMLVGMTPKAMSEAFDWGGDQGREAEEVLLDQAFFTVDAGAFKQIQALLDSPPEPTEKLRRFLLAKPP